jgi:trehalose/maltose transport system permease protein
MAGGFRSNREETMRPARTIAGSLALTFTLSPEQRTVPVAIALISGASAYELPWGQVMAASVIVTLPLIALVLLLQRRIVAGLTAGAVKG